MLIVLFQSSSLTNVFICVYVQVLVDQPLSLLQSRKFKQVIILYSTKSFPSLSLSLSLSLSVCLSLSLSASTAQLDIDDAMTAGSRTPFSTPPERRRENLFELGDVLEALQSVGRRNSQPVSTFASLYSFVRFKGLFDLSLSFFGG